MAIPFFDRVKETTTTTGTGTLTLLGAATNFQPFSVVGDGNQTYYAIEDSANDAWEVGIGTYTLSGTTLSRDTVLASSNGGSIVTLGAGTKDVFLPLPADIASAILPKSDISSVNSLPGSPNTGDVAFTNDSLYVCRYNGTGWDRFGGAIHTNFFDPNLITWSWVNQDTATVDSTNGYIYLQCVAGAGVHSINMRVKAVPTAPYTIDIALTWVGNCKNNVYTFAGLVWRNSGSGQLITLTMRGDGPFFMYDHWTDEHNYGGNLFSGNALFYAGMPMFWVRLTDDTVNRKVYISKDGYHWEEFFSEGSGSFITPDQVGFWVDNYNADGAMMLHSWHEY